jgi:hypothetical protein
VEGLIEDVCKKRSIFGCGELLQNVDILTLGIFFMAG